MKVCIRCGQEISTRDGDNTCTVCMDHNNWKLTLVKRKTQRKNYDAIMRSCGLTKVKGAMGGTYWE